MSIAAGIKRLPTVTPMLVAQPPQFPPGIAFVVLLIGLTVVSGRLLGVRVGWFRGFLAAFFGTVAGFADYYLQSTENPGGADFVLTFGLPALLVTMVVIVTLDLASRPGAVTPMPTMLAGLPHPMRGLTDRVARGRRYLQVLSIAARNGLNPYIRGGSAAVQKTPAQSHRLAVGLRRSLEQSGGIFVKLGQVLSTRFDLLPAAVTSELGGLQDAVAPVAFRDLRPILEEQYAAGIAGTFAEFQTEPIAAASIAQVHAAVLRSGQRVVVKIQRPRITPIIERDLDIIQRLARALQARADWARRLGIVELADGFAVAVMEELDFQIEAGNLDALRVGAAANSGVRVPRVHREFSGSRVLVMEWLDGVKLAEAASLLDELGIDRLGVARQLLICVLRQIMIDGQFHADPHPGNVLILRDGSPALIDFGSIGRLDAAQQSALRRIFVSFDRRNAAQMRDALVELAVVEDTRQQEALERALSLLMATRLVPGMRPGAALFMDLMHLLVDFGLSLPPHVAAVFRSLVTLEGTLKVLDPSFDIVHESRQLAGDVLADAVSPTSILSAVQDELMTQYPILHRLPRRLDQLAATLESGRLTVRVGLFETQSERRFLQVVAGRATLAFVGGVLGIIAVLMLGTSGGPPLTPSVSMIHGLGYAALCAACILMLRVVVGVAREQSA